MRAVRHFLPLKVGLPDTCPQVCLLVYPTLAPSSVIHLLGRLHHVHSTPERVISCARGRRRIARSSDELAASSTCSASALMSRQGPRPSPPVPPPAPNPPAIFDILRPVTGAPVCHAPNASNAPAAAALQGTRALR